MRFEMIYENKIIKFLACGKGEKVYNKKNRNYTYFQQLRDTTYIYEQ
jgi:hypothetical protein